MNYQEKTVQRSSNFRRGSTPVFLLEPPTKYHFSNNTGGVLDCAGTSGNHGSSLEVSWTTSDYRPVHPVSIFLYNIISLRF